MRLTGSVRIYWTSVEKVHEAWGFHKILEGMKQKLKNKYLLNFFKHRLLDKLYSLRQVNRSVQDYTIEFDDLTLCCEVQEDSYQAIFRYSSGLKSEIQRAMFIHVIETLEHAAS